MNQPTPMSSVLLYSNNSSASQQVPLILWNPQVHYQVYMIPPLVPILCQISPVHPPPPIPFFKIDFNIVLQSMPRSLFLRFSHKNPVRISSPPPYILYTQTITFVFIWSPGYYLVWTTDHEARHYTVSSSPLFPHPLQAQIYSSAPYSCISSEYVPPSMWQTGLSHHIKQAKSEFCIF